MDLLLQGLLNFKNENFDECIDNCEKILKSNEYDQAAWCLKMKAMTLKVHVNDFEHDQNGIADVTFGDNNISNITKPGTSFKSSVVSSDNLTQTMRPSSSTGRSITGFLHLKNESNTGLNLEQSIKTPRTTHTARPISSTSDRFIRLGTASMMNNSDGPFIIISRLNLQKYANRQALAKSLFEYILYHENDVRRALELAALATESNSFQDCWWKIQLGKCYFRLGLYRDAEQQFRSALSHQKILEAYLWLGKIFEKLDQPISALEIYQKGLQNFPFDISILILIARIYQNLGKLSDCKETYKYILEQDNMNIEVIACIANNYFYEDQVEIALKFYRRLFQMGIQNIELLNNLALCCFYSQQFDMCIACFSRALMLASKTNISDLYYNIGIIALSIGDNSLAYQNFRLALSYDNEHAESYNNLGVLEMYKGNIDMARAFLQAASTTNSRLFESHLNFGLLAEQSGDLQTSYLSIKKALVIFPNHCDANDIIRSISEIFSSV